MSLSATETSFLQFKKQVPLKFKNTLPAIQQKEGLSIHTIFDPCWISLDYTVKKTCLCLCPYPWGCPCSCPCPCMNFVILISSDHFPRLFSALSMENCQHLYSYFCRQCFNFKCFLRRKKKLIVAASRQLSALIASMDSFKQVTISTYLFTSMELNQWELFAVCLTGMEKLVPYIPLCLWL